MFEALLLGLLEGLTEFLPVSSTGHILLAGHFLGFQSTGKAFEVLIQLGAILAILSVYAGRLIDIVRTLPSDPATRRFVAGILLAFLPAAVIGALAHDFIKTVLFETPMLICVMLILGGVVLLWIDKAPLKPRYFDVMDFPLSLCLKIGFIQCLAMIPGTSRSGATIVGSLLLGADKRSAAEFSFWLAMPTMAGAFAYDLYKNWHALSAADLPSDRRSRRFVLGILLAFLPAAVIGAVMHGAIKQLFEVPMVICVALILGGVVLLYVDRLKLDVRYHDVMDYPLRTSFLIGIFQCMAMIPGVSRSGATIVGAMLLGADKRSAAEFSFFLAMPTMAGAFAYDLYKNWKVLDVNDVAMISLGFVVSFFAALFVVRFLLDYVSRHGFALFGWWRIIVGGIGLGALLVLG